METPQVRASEKKAAREAPQHTARSELEALNLFKVPEYASPRSTHPLSIAAQTDNRDLGSELAEGLIILRRPLLLQSLQALCWLLKTNATWVWNFAAVAGSGPSLIHAENNPSSEAKQRNTVHSTDIL